MLVATGLLAAAELINSARMEGNEQAKWECIKYFEPTFLKVISGIPDQYKADAYNQLCVYLLEFISKGEGDAISSEALEAVAFKAWQNLVPCDESIRDRPTNSFKSDEELDCIALCKKRWGRLTDLEKTVFKMVALEDFDTEEVSEQLGKDLNIIEDAYASAIMKLRRS